MLRAAALLLIFAASAVAADKPYPIFTPENFTNTMQLIGRNFAAVNSALSKNDFDSAKAQLARSRELLALTVTFWRDRKKDDATKILRDTVTRMDELDAALSAEKIDLAAAAAIAKQIGNGCQSCHTAYREQDPGTKTYRFKKGLVQ
jgi:cytochrome c556